MYRYLPTILAACLVSALAFVGCANPADNKPAAEVSDALSAPAQADGAEAGRVYVISSGSTLNWVGSKVTGRHDGGFNTFEGTFSVPGGDLAAGQMKLTIDTTSIWADNPRLTNHLKGKDFFEVEAYPTSTFTSTSIEKLETGYAITGNFELHGVTKSITFPAELTLTGDHMSVRAEFSINRSDFGIKYRGKANDLIRDEVLILFDIKASA